MDLGPVELSARLSFPANDGCLAFNVTVGLASGLPLTLDILTNHVLDDVEALPVLGDVVKDVLNVGFDDMYMTLEPKCKRIYLHATVSSSFFLDSDMELNLDLGSFILSPTPTLKLTLFLTQTCQSRLLMAQNLHSNEPTGLLEQRRNRYLGFQVQDRGSFNSLASYQDPFLIE